MNNSDAVFASLESLVKDQYQTYRLNSIQGKKTVKHNLGENLSSFKGRGMDFDEVREYQSGDDVRLVDWRLTAKAGKAYTKIFHEERDRHIWFLLDLRKGMKFGTKQAFKSVIAAHITAMLSWFFYKKGDKIGGLVLSDKKMQVFNPSKIRNQVMTFFNAISEATKKSEHFEKKEEEISLAQACLKLRRTCRNGNIIFIISDFSDLNDDSLKCLASVARTNEISFINVYDVLEGRCPSPNLYNISDGTSLISLDTRLKDIHDSYIYYFQKKLWQILEFTNKFHIRYIPVSSEDDYYDVVAKALQKSRRRKF